MDKEDIVPIYMEHYLTIKKNEIMPSAATWIDLKIIILSLVRKRKTNTIWYPLYLESKKKPKNDTKELTYKTEIDPQTLEKKKNSQLPKLGERDKLGGWD